MTDMNKQRSNAALSFVIASIIAFIIKNIIGFTYNASVHGLDYRILISLFIMLIPFLILYYSFDKLFFNKSNKNDDK